MKGLIASIPNAITSGNLICGLLGIMAVMNGDLHIAFWLIVIAGLLDFLDGFAARLLKVSSPLGAQLDSLADLVTFGVLPGLIQMQLMEQYGYCPKDSFCINRYVWLFFSVAGAWRLAKFNTDTRQTSGFLGVPIPISGLALASVALSAHYQTPLHEWYTNFWVLKAMPMVMGLMMVSEFPMLALKFKKGDTLNAWKFGFIGLAVLLAALFRLDSMPLIYVAYVLTSFLANFVTKTKQDHG